MNNTYTLKFTRQSAWTKNTLKVLFFKMDATNGEEDYTLYTFWHKIPEATNWMPRELQNNDLMNFWVEILGAETFSNETLNGVLDFLFECPNEPAVKELTVEAITR